MKSVLRSGALVISLTVALAACTGSPNLSGRGRTTGPSSSGEPAAGQPLHGAELHYGASATRAAGIVYQPDVVVIDHGAAAVRSVSADGLVWTLDATAPGVADLAVGKVMLATTMGSGRVLHLARTGNDEQVVLGPVALTDVFQQARLASTSPIDLSSPLYYSTSYPDAVTKTATAGAFAAVRTSGPPLPPPSTSPRPANVGQLHLTPIKDARGIGLEIYGHQGTGKVRASLTLHVTKPTATFTLVIGDGKVIEASVRVHGTGGVHVDFDAIQKDDSGRFKVATLPLPTVFTFPLNVAGIPLTLSITQDFNLSVQLSGSAELHTHGEYDLTGDLAFGVRNGQPLPLATTAYTADPISHNTTYLGYAAGAIAFGWGLTASVGVGVPEFNVGAYFQLRFGASVDAAASTDALHPGCSTVSVEVDAAYGIGYHVPDILVKVLNFVLDVFGVDAKIPASGGLAYTSPLFDPPPAKYCRPAQQGPN